MQRDRLVLGLTGVFAGMTALLLLVSVAFREPVLFVVALPLGAATYAFWYQSSGALRERLRRTRRRPDPDERRQRGGFDAGPRAGFEGARGQRARERWEQRQQAAQGQQAGRRRTGEGGRRRRRGVGPQASATMPPAEAYRHLGLDSDADEGEVRRAYRERVKEVHPDRGGDEEEFRKVTEAYETLSG